MDTLYIDVREPDEFKKTRIAESVNIPLSAFKNSVDTITRLAKNFKIVLICQSGTRAGNALNQLDKKENVEVFEGGLNNWQDETVFIKGESSGGIPLMRQVMIAAGLLVLIGSVGAVTLNFNMVWLSVFVGAGLTFAGLSGICLMAQMLAKMPWNSK